MSLDRRNARARLFDDLQEAIERTEGAKRAFVEVTGEIPSGLPPEEGLERIRNASRELITARSEMMKAYKRLDEFLVQGSIPEELQGATQRRFY